jgi:glycosyltransferase involved in cell wall biosynthesis
MSTKPSVSAIIPVFNGERTIARAIDSALAQRFDGEVEIIVVNDGSTDATAEILRGYRDRIIVVTQTGRGVAAARNAGVARSKGELVAFLDADDEWLPSKLARLTEELDSDPSCGLAYSDVIVVDEGKGPRSESYILGDFRRAPEMRDLLRAWWHIFPSAVVMRRSLFEAAGSFPQEFGDFAYGGEDALLWIRARAIASFRFISEPLAKYYVPPPSGQIAKRIPHSSDSTGNRKYRAQSLVRGDDMMVKLLRRDYGRRAKALIDYYRKTEARILLTFAMLAMHEGNQRFARECYLASLKRWPWQALLPARLAWTFLPRPVARSVAARMPGRVARALCGPPMM